MQVKKRKNYLTKLAQQVANGPVSMPQELKPMCLIHLEFARFRLFPLHFPFYGLRDSLESRKMSVPEP